MIGDYRLAQVVEVVREGGRIGSRPSFAHVYVEVETHTDRGVIIDAVGQQVNRKLGEVTAKTHSDWINAAIEGARETLTYFEKFNQKIYLVKIIKVIGIEVDTDEDTVKTAAAIATWRAINPDNSEPVAIFENGIWSAAFPK